MLLERKEDENRISKMNNFSYFQQSLDKNKKLGLNNEELETIIKKHLDVIVLSLLKKKPMCGQDIIKEIFAQFDVFINQSSIYPILYSLKDRHVIEIHPLKGDLRTKIYVPTEKGMDLIDEKLNDFAIALNYMLSLIR
ncbi:MAG TPA: PadR family transcriptional regulator [Methanosarcina sp.]|nr:PadR family transcriptional regulator [Methanosarcina sp.]